MSDSSTSIRLRTAIPVAVGILIGMGAGKAVAGATLPAFGYWGALLANMLTAAAVAGLIAMLLLYLIGRRPLKN
jgi:hypothetical protein